MTPEIITTGEIQFGEAETITVDQLVTGDFVVAFPTQAGIRGYRVNSGIREISAPAYGRWAMSGGRGRPRRQILSRKIRFLDANCGGVDLPLTHEIIVRRQITEG